MLTVARNGFRKFVAFELAVLIRAKHEHSTCSCESWLRDGGFPRLGALSRPWVDAEAWKENSSQVLCVRRIAMASFESQPPASDGLLSPDSRKNTKRAKGAKSLILGRLGLEPGTPASQLQAIRNQVATLSKQLQNDGQERSPETLLRVTQVQECLELLTRINGEDGGENGTEESESNDKVWGLSGVQQQHVSFLSDANNKAAKTKSYIVHMGLSDVVDNMNDEARNEIDLEALGRLTETELAQAGLSVLQRVKIGVTMGRIASGMEAMHTLLSQLGMAQYVQLFVDNEVDLDSFGLLSDEDIIELGVDNEFHRQVLISAAQPSTLMQQCLVSMLSAENQAAEEHAAELDKIPISAETAMTTESSLAQYEALDPTSSTSKIQSTSKFQQILKTATVEDELEACKRVIREMLLERSTVVSRLCQEIRNREIREAKLAQILETGTKGRELGDCGPNDGASQDPIVEAERNEILREDLKMHAGAVEVDEAIMMMLGGYARLSRGKSDKLQGAVLDHCPPILCSLVEHGLLLEWCSAVLKHGLGEENRLVWAVRAKLAEKLLFTLADDAKKQAQIIETSFNLDNLSRQEDSDEEAPPPSAPPDAEKMTAPLEEARSSSLSADLVDHEAPSSSTRPPPLAESTPEPESQGEQEAANRRSEDMAGVSPGVYSSLRDAQSPRSQLLPKLPPMDLQEGGDEASRNSPLLVKNLHAEDDGTGQALPLAFDSFGFAVIAQPPDESLQMPAAVVGWRVHTIAKVKCRFKTLPELQELFWREQGSGTVDLVLVSGVEGSDAYTETQELSVPAGTLVVQAQPPAELEAASAPEEQCYLVVLRRIPRAKSSSLSEAVGVGLTLQKEKDGQFRVVSLLPGGAAAESGRVGQGDLVRSINGRLVQGRSVEDVMQLIKGAPGTRVAILFAPSDGRAPRMRPHRTVPGWKPKMGEIKVQVASASGLKAAKSPPSIFCQLRILSTTMDEELVGVGRAGIEIGMRVHKSRYLKDKEAAMQNQDAAAEEVGTVVNIQDEGMTCQVLWDDATEQWYATGLAGEHDLEVSPEVTTMCESATDIRWDSVLTLSVRELETAFLECSVWDADILLGEAILQLSPLSDVPWEVVEKHLPLQDAAAAPQPALLLDPDSPTSTQALGENPSVHLAVCWVPMPAAPTIDSVGGMLA